jgi:pyrroloquinoline quinone (PQQ) biosynthesis protein C
MTWGELASMLAAIYTLCLLAEWVWKKVLKPIAIHNGWIKGAHRDFLDSSKRDLP